MKVYDILLDDSDDVAIAGGDFVMGESTAQHQKRLVLDNAGEYKEHPTVGVGAFDWLDADSIDDLAAEIARQFAVDGMTVTSVKLVNGVIETDANF